MSVSYVLARAAEEGIAEAVIGAASPFDPLLRGGIRKRARKAIADAGSLTRVQDEAHVIRVAFLQSIGQAGRVPLDDPAAVEGAFVATKTKFPKKKRAFWPVSFGVSAAVGVVALVLVFFVFAPAKRDRFAHTAIGEAFGEGLTDYVIGVNRRDRERIDKGRKVLTARGVKSQAGDTAKQQIEDALDQTMKLGEALDKNEADAARGKLEGTLRSLDQQLASKKVPAFLDEHDEADIFTGSLRVWLIGYYAEQRAQATVGGDSFYVLWGRRLDTLNLDVGGTIYTSDALKASVLSIDEVESFVTRKIVPGLAKNAGLSFGSEPADELSGLGRMEKKMGTAVRAELLPIANMSEDDGTELRDLTSGRHGAFERLHVLGDDMFEPQGIRMNDKLRRALSRRDTEVDAKELLRIDERLQRGTLVSGYDTIVLEQAKLEERRYLHDQHVFNRSGTITTSTFQAAAGKEKLSVRTSSRIAGWLGMLADAERTTLALTELARASDPEGAAQLALFAIESELGSAPTWLVSGRFKDEEDALRALEDALKRPAADIKKAAGGAYGRLLGEPIPPVQRALK